MFKQVRPNENFRPSAEFHNATARLLNNLGTIGDGRFRGKRGGGGSAYDGPFAATIEPPTEGRENEIHVKLSPGRIWAGTTKIDFPGDEFYTSAGGKDDIAYLLSIYYDEEYFFHYSFEKLESYDQFVGQSNFGPGYRYAVPLVLIKADGRIVQLQHGDIFIAGRCV